MNELASLMCPTRQVPPSSPARTPGSSTLGATAFVHFNANGQLWAFTKAGHEDTQAFDALAMAIVVV